MGYDGHPPKLHDIEALRWHDRQAWEDLYTADLLGLGRLRSLIPVGAITRISGEAVHVNQTRQHVGEAPTYDPDLIDEREGSESHYGDLYRHYGLPPHWERGYTYPRYPRNHDPHA